jgi:hypothetical protein
MSGFFLKKKYYTRLKIGLQGIYISRIVKGVNKDGFFSFQGRLVRTDKF